MVEKALHFAVGLLGLLLLYMALFLTETAEGNIQNRLEALWIAVDDLSKVAVSRQAAFLQQVSRLIGAIFDKLFGKKLISAKAVATSICFSSAAPLIAIEFLLFEGEYFSLAVLMLLAMILIGVGLAPVPIRYLAFVWVLILAAYILYMHGNFLIILTVLGLSIGSDILFIALSRWYLRRSERLANAWKILSLLMFNLLIGLFLIGPLVYSLLAPGRVTDMRSMWAFLGASNLITALVPLLFALLSLIAISHLAIWPLLQGPIYSAQRYGIVRQPKLLGALGTMCLMSAWPKSPLVQMISKIRHLS